MLRLKKTLYSLYRRPVRTILKFIHNHFGVSGEGQLSSLRVLPNKFPQTYEPTFTNVIVRYVNSSDICIDIGGHYGYFTLLFSKLNSPGGKVFTFEADVGNKQIIDKHIQLNNLQARCKVVHAAVSDEHGEIVDLYLGRDGSSEYNIIGQDVTGTKTESVAKVQTITLDNHFKNHSRIDFIKMDIEGAEAKAIAGMRNILKKHRPILLVEFHNQKAWQSRHMLYDADYILHDLEREHILEKGKDLQRAYHCLAIPSERHSLLNQ